VSGFSAEWLALREPADAVARSETVVAYVARPFQGRLVDLGGGTGANVRYLSTRLPAPQRWTIVDDDAALLGRAPAGVTRHQADLNQVVDDDDLFRECGLVTASALLDLVSERWLSRLIARCSLVRAAVLFALTYDGQTVCRPAELEDDEVTRLVNEHQRRDKGFGAALGPAAAAYAVELLTTAGYEVKHERSDWHLGPTDAELQRQLIDGWAKAASDMRSERAATYADWRRRRLAHVDARGSRIVVGHVDVAGIRRA
jgi:hypothetical protein